MHSLVVLPDGFASALTGHATLHRGRTVITTVPNEVGQAKLVRAAVVSAKRHDYLYEAEDRTRMSRPRRGHHAVIPGWEARKPVRWFRMCCCLLPEGACQ
jgi:hypothetical protein